MDNERRVRLCCDQRQARAQVRRCALFFLAFGIWVFFIGVDAVLRSVLWAITKTSHQESIVNDGRSSAPHRGPIS